MSGNIRTAEQSKAQNIAAMGSELGELYSVLWQQVTWLYSKWGEYVALFGTKPNRIEILNSTAPVFFKTIQDGLWENILLHIARITDSQKSGKKDNLTFLRLPNLILNVGHKTSVEELLQISIDTSKFARDWRNRRIAHSDLKLVLDQGAEPLAPASKTQVQGALAAVAAVLNNLSNTYLDSTTMFDFASEPSAGGALSMLKYLRAGKDAELQRFARLKSGIYTPEDRKHHEI